MQWKGFAKSEHLLIDSKKKNDIIDQIRIIMTIFSAFFLSAMCSSAVSVRQNRKIVLAVWIVTLLLWYQKIKGCAKEKDCDQQSADTLTAGIRSHKEIIFVLLFAAVTRLFMITSIQRWDAASYYGAFSDACRMFDLTFDTFFNCFRLMGHPTLGYSFIMSIGEFLFPKRVIGYSLENLILTIIALYDLYLLFAEYWLQIPKKRVAVYVLCISCVPLFWGTFSYCNPDYSIIIFFIFMILAEARKQYLLMTFWLAILFLTKEPAIVVVAGYFLARGVYDIAKREENWKKRIANLYQDRVMWIAAMGFLVAIAYFVKQGGLFAWYGVSLQNLFTRKEEAGMFQNAFLIDLPHIWNQIKQVFVLNFAWIFTLILFVALICMLAGKKYMDSNQQTDGDNRCYIGIWGSFWLVSVFFMLFITVPLNRYHVFTSVVLAMMGFLGYEMVLRKQWNISAKVEKLGGLAIFLLLSWQTFFSLDPVSNLLFEQINTGKMAMLKTDGGVSVDSFGDELVNNYQYRWLDDELNGLLSGVQYDEDTLIIDAGIQRDKVDIGSGSGYKAVWNTSKQKRELVWGESDSLGEGFIPIETLSTRRMQLHLSEDSEDSEHFYKKYMSDKERAVVYFIPYYGESEQEWIEYLGQFYEIGERKETNGMRGNIAYYILTLKKNEMDKRYLTAED